MKYHNFLSMNISKYKLYKNGKYTYVYNGFISVVSCLIKYSVITSKTAEKYRPLINHIQNKNWKIITPKYRGTYKTINFISSIFQITSSCSNFKYVYAKILMIGPTLSLTGCEVTVQN